MPSGGLADFLPEYTGKIAWTHGRSARKSVDRKFESKVVRDPGQKIWQHPRVANVVERAVIMSEGEAFFVDEAWLTRVTPKLAATSVPLVADLAEREREMLEAALRESQGVVGGPTGAAVKLGIPRQTLESKIRKLGINRYRFKAS